MKRPGLFILVSRMTGTLLAAEQISSVSALDMGWQLVFQKATSVYSRLVLCSSLRNPETGAYSEKQLAAGCGEEAANSALAQIHVSCFDEWLQLGLEEQAADLALYLATEPGRRDSIMKGLGKTRGEAVIPPGTSDSDQMMFRGDFGVLLRHMQAA